LKFGVQHYEYRLAAFKPIFDREIFELCKLLGVSNSLIGKTADEFSLGPEAKKYTLIGLNGERLSLTDRALLTLARALLSSVDFLLISNLLDVLGPNQAIRVIAVLKELTEKRGLSVLQTETMSTPMHLRKKKTVIFSTKLKV
jgi:ABC-type multidrug transport system ATPase subunit